MAMGSIVSRTAHFALHRRCIMPDDIAAVVALRKQYYLNNDQNLKRPPEQPIFNGCEVWLGAVIPKRYAKRAVTRNAIKRQIYSVGSALELQLPCAAYVVRLHSGFDRKCFLSATSVQLKQAVRQELMQLFAKLLTPMAAQSGSAKTMPLHEVEMPGGAR